LVEVTALPAVFAVFCSKLSAIGASFSAEILGRVRFGGARNSERRAVLPLFFAVPASAFAETVSDDIYFHQQYHANICIVKKTKCRSLGLSLPEICQR
jgi:hypothetical protein